MRQYSHECLSRVAKCAFFAFQISVECQLYLGEHQTFCMLNDSVDKSNKRTNIKKEQAETYRTGCFTTKQKG